MGHDSSQFSQFNQLYTSHKQRPPSGPCAPHDVDRLQWRFLSCYSTTFHHRKHKSIEKKLSYDMQNDSKTNITNSNLSRLFMPYVAACDAESTEKVSIISTSARCFGSVKRQGSKVCVPQPFHIQGRSTDNILCFHPRDGLLSGHNSQQSSLESARHGVWAGSVAGVIAETLMHPFDTISMRQKCHYAGRNVGASYQGLIGTARSMIREEGAFSLMNGVSVTALSAVPSSALYFGSYEMAKSVGLSFVDDVDPNGAFGWLDTTYKNDFVHLLAGIFSELCASLVVVPSEVVKSRMQLGGSGPTAYKSAVHGILKIASSEGMNGLYSGYRACLLQDCSFSAIQFCLYERLRRDMKTEKTTANGGHSYLRLSLVSNDNVKDLPLDDLVDSIEDTAEDLLAGAVAGGLSVFVTNPLDVACARLMTQNWTKPSEKFMYSGTMDCLAKVVRTEGIRGLWSGSLARTLSVAPLSAITFGIYEKMKCFLTRDSCCR